MKNPTIEEVWKIKDELARECGHDLNKLADLLRRRQKEGKHQVVDFSEKQAGNAAARN